MKPLLTVKELSEKLKIAQKTLYEWAAKGYIPSLKMGACIRFDEKEIEEWQKKMFKKYKNRLSVDFFKYAYIIAHVVKHWRNR